MLEETGDQHDELVLELNESDSERFEPLNESESSEASSHSETSTWSFNMEA